MVLSLTFILRFFNKYSDIIGACKNVVKVRQNLDHLHILHIDFTPIYKCSCVFFLFVFTSLLCVISTSSSVSCVFMFTLCCVKGRMFWFSGFKIQSKCVWDFWKTDHTQYHILNYNGVWKLIMKQDLT